MIFCLTHAIYESTYNNISLGLCQPVDQLTSQPTHLSTCQHVILEICPFFYLSTCQPVDLSPTETFNLSNSEGNPFSKSSGVSISNRVLIQNSLYKRLVPIPYLSLLFHVNLVTLCLVPLPHQCLLPGK